MVRTLVLKMLNVEKVLEKYKKALAPEQILSKLSKLLKERTKISQLDFFAKMEIIIGSIL